MGPDANSLLYVLSVNCKIPLSATFLTVRKTERSMIKSVYSPSRKVPVTLVRL